MKRIIILSFTLMTINLQISAQQESQVDGTDKKTSNVNWDFMYNNDIYLKEHAPGSDKLVMFNRYFLQNNYKEANDWIVLAEKEGNLFASFFKAYLQTIGKEEFGNAKAGVNNLCQLANTYNYFPAMMRLADIYKEGDIVDKDLNASFYYLKKAAEKNSYAKPYLAEGYLLGIHGAPQNIKKGLEIAEECAMGGSVYSQLLLGNYYADVSNPADLSKASKWYNMAQNNIENGERKLSSGEYRRFAYALGQGKGIKQDFKKAHQYINMAIQRSDNGENPVLLETEGELFRLEGKLDEATAIWEKMKNKYPDYIEKNKYEVENVFVRTMYKKEQEANKASIASNNNAKPTTPVIVSDIDEKIPENAVVGNPTFAVIIANEKYKEVEEVPYANHDGETFKQYCEKTLGIPKSNIKYVPDATLNNIRRELNWLGQVMDVYQGEANIIFYYAGHGIPNESNGSAYLLPVDGVGNDVSTGYSLDKLYADLSSKPAKSVVVLLDACFSGAKRNGGMIASARGVTIKAKQNAPKGKMVVLSAAQGDETAYPYKEKGHGIFTYYLLKKLQETKGDVSFGELADYVTAEVKKQSIVINGKMQTPLVSPSSVATDWRNWKLR